jgi:hypothetical protein
VSVLRYILFIFHINKCWLFISINIFKNIHVQWTCTFFLYLRLAFQISWESQEPAILVCIDQKPRGSVSGPRVKYWYANVKMTILIGLWCLMPLSTILQLYSGGVPRENHRPVASHWQTLSHNVVLSTPRHERGSNSQL